ncbi:methyltransferase type 11 [Salinarchaeum sp. Harcht-Bsk1]|uniref:class I SAM-dependent methyltransferase n=1 Tax=Salinarchaeum sp. Harcht-Bsk1 TaxID=1333523 RepID=UPI0003423918|nr:class I SAM-dependent methyltransferase [Salinarchaeum sp. Harcht-Bsk1]AGN01149.1 methyltransferase type 11 [Salinarchaeum sp. Harcht-Bsk1]
MSLYRPRARPKASVYDAAYTGAPNWDIGRPQSAFVRLEEAGLIEDPVLDAGCGTGELACFLARRGHRVLGVDLSTLAVRQAREKARWRRIDARFLVWDALQLERLATAGFSFRTVVDSGLFHVLGPAERDRLADGLAAVLEPGGLYAVLGDARHPDREFYGVTPGEFADRFPERSGWERIFAVETTFERRWGGSPAFFVGLRRRE